MLLRDECAIEIQDPNPRLGEATKHNANAIGEGKKRPEAGIHVQA
jgi:hypothetical protein